MCGSLVDTWMSCRKHSMARFRQHNLRQEPGTDHQELFRSIWCLGFIEKSNEKTWLVQGKNYTGTKRSQRAWYIMYVYLSRRVMKHQLTLQQIEPSWGPTGIIDWTLNCWVLMHTYVSPQRIVCMFLTEDGRTHGTWSDHGLCSMHVLWLNAVSCWNWGMNKLIVNHLGRHFVAWS